PTCLPRRTIRGRLELIVGSYEEICAAHVWRVPERYNIAADCCDKHPRDKLAMIHEGFDGVQRELTWGELQALSNRAANLHEAHRYLLAHEEFVYCHEVEDGERFHGMGEWAWAAGIAPLLGPWRLGAVQCVYQREGGFDPHRQLDFLSRHCVTNVFTTPTAMRSMMGIGDAGTRYPC